MGFQPMWNSFIEQTTIHCETPMPTAEEIKKLVEKMPELDVPPPAPPIPEDAEEKEKQDLRRRASDQARLFRGKLTGPAWEDAARNILDPILAGGKDAIL